MDEDGGGKAWSIKGIDPEMRDGFTMAAKRARVTVGRFFNTYGPQMLRHHLAETGDLDAASNLVAAPTTALVPVKPSIDGLPTTADLVRLASEASGGNPKSRVMAEARRLVSAQIAARLREFG